MRLLNLTLPSAFENLALDEALLDEAEESATHEGVLRLWESPQPLVVIGRSSRISEEANLAYCREANVEVLRRVSGGAAIVAGPGCLMYAAILSMQQYPFLQQIDQAHQFVLGKIREAIAAFVPQVEIAGISDLAVAGKKFSGNSLRCKRSHILYHGTLLYDFPLESVAQLLGTPPRQPEYRAGRTHLDFITNLSVTRQQLEESLPIAWQCSEASMSWPRERTARLVEEKYSRTDWNQRL